MTNRSQAAPLATLSRRLAAALAAAVVVACGSSSPVSGSTDDAGKGGDATKPVDASKVGDARKLADSAHDVAVDSYASLDSGTSVASCGLCTDSEVCVISGRTGGACFISEGGACTNGATGMCCNTYEIFACYPRPASCGKSTDTCNCQDSFCPGEPGASCTPNGASAPVVSCVEEYA